MVRTVGCDRSVWSAIECLEASTRNTREKGKQTVKRVESGLIPCPFISCLKPITKAFVLAAIGQLANVVATGVAACTCTIVCEGLIV
jgi:hypothetical protein